MNKLKRIGLYLLFFAVGNFFTAPVINGAQQLTPENIKRLMAVDSQETLLAYVRDFMDPNVTTINAPIANAVQALQQAYRAAQQGNTAVANQAVLTAEQNIQIGRGRTSPVATLEPRVQPENIAPIVKAIEEEVKVVQALAPEQRKERQAIQEQEIIQTKREEAPLLTQQRIPSPTPPPITEEPLVATSSAPRVDLGPEYKDIKKQTQLTQQEARRLEALRIKEARRLEALRIEQERKAHLEADKQKAAEAARLKQEAEDRALAQRLADEEKAAAEAARRLKQEAEDLAAAQKLADEERIAAEKAAEDARLKKEQEDKDRAAVEKLRKDTAATAADKAKQEAQEVLQDAQAGLQKILDQARTLELDRTEDFKRVQEAVKNPNKTGSYIWAKKEAQLAESLMQSQALPQKNAEFKQRINSMRGIILPFEQAVIATLETSIEEADAEQKAKTRPAGPLWITHVPATTPTLPPVSPEPILPKVIKKPKTPAAEPITPAVVAKPETPVAKEPTAEELLQKDIEKIVANKKKELDQLIQTYTALELDKDLGKGQSYAQQFTSRRAEYEQNLKKHLDLLHLASKISDKKELTKIQEDIKNASDAVQAFEENIIMHMNKLIKDIKKPQQLENIYKAAEQKEKQAKREESKQLTEIGKTLHSLKIDVNNATYKKILDELSNMQKTGFGLPGGHIEMVGKYARAQHLINENIFKSSQDKQDALTALSKKEVIDTFKDEINKLLSNAMVNQPTATHHPQGLTPVTSVKIKKPKTTEEIYIEAEKMADTVHQNEIKNLQKLKQQYQKLSLSEESKPFQRLLTALNAPDRDYLGTKKRMAFAQYLKDIGIFKSEEEKERLTKFLSKTGPAYIKEFEQNVITFLQYAIEAATPAKAPTPKPAAGAVADSTTFENSGVQKGFAIRFRDLNGITVPVTLTGTIATFIKKLAPVFNMNDTDLKILDQDNQEIPLTVQALIDPNLRNQTLLVVHKEYKVPSKKPAVQPAPPAVPAPAAPQPQPGGGPVAANDTFTIASANVLDQRSYRTNFKPRQDNNRNALSLDTRKAYFTTLINQLNPSVLALQEYDLKNSPLPDFKQYEFITDAGYGVDSGTKLFLGLRKDYFETANKAIVKRFTKTAGANENGYVGLIAKIKDSKEFIGIINTHLKGGKPNEFVGNKDDFAAAQLNAIIATIQEYPFAKHWIICGDFNWEWAQAGEAEQWAQKNGFAINDTRLTAIDPNSKFVKIDYILSKGLQQIPNQNQHVSVTPAKEQWLTHSTVGQDQQRKHFSDHAVLFTEFKVPAAAPAP